MMKEFPGAIGLVATLGEAHLQGLKFGVTVKKGCRPIIAGAGGVLAGKDRRAREGTKHPGRMGV